MGTQAFIAEVNSYAAVYGWHIWMDFSERK